MRSALENTLRQFPITDDPVHILAVAQFEQIGLAYLGSIAEKIASGGAGEHQPPQFGFFFGEVGDFAGQGDPLGGEEEKIGVDPTQHFHGSRAGQGAVAGDVVTAGAQDADISAIQQFDDFKGVGDDGQVPVVFEIGDHVLDRGRGIHDQGGSVVQQFSGFGSDHVLLGAAFLGAQRQGGVGDGGILGKHDTSVDTLDQPQLFQGADITAHGGFADIQFFGQIGDVDGFSGFQDGQDLVLALASQHSGSSADDFTKCICKTLQEFARKNERVSMFSPHIDEYGKLIYSEYKEFVSKMQENERRYVKRRM